MSGKFTPAKLMLLGCSIGLLPCMALAVDMPANPLSEQVDTTHLGEVQEGVTARTEAGWTVQVGAFADKDKAEAQLETLAADRSQLRNAVRLITPVKWDDAHTIYRARFAGLSLEAASALCASLNGVGQACFLSQADPAHDKPAPQEANTSPATDDMRATGLLKDAPAMLVASTTGLNEALTAVPEFSTIAEKPARSMAPKLVALNGKLARDKAGEVSNDELSGMRGGFFTAAGAQFDFGASIKTMVNGQLALQTNLTWTPQGANISSLAGLGQQITDQVQSNLAKAGIGTGNASTLAVNTPSTLGNLGSAASNAASNPASAAGNIANPATNLATGAVSNGLNSAANAVGGASSPTAATTPRTMVTIPTAVTGVTIPGAGGGSTTVLANLSANQIQSILLNSASNQNISQDTNVTLTIYNLQQWQQQLVQHALSAQLAHELMAASGLGH